MFNAEQIFWIYNYCNDYFIWELLIDSNNDIKHILAEELKQAILFACTHPNLSCQIYSIFDDFITIDYVKEMFTSTDNRKKIITTIQQQGNSIL